MGLKVYWLERFSRDVTSMWDSCLWVRHFVLDSCLCVWHLCKTAAYGCDNCVGHFFIISVTFVPHSCLWVTGDTATFRRGNCAGQLFKEYEICLVEGNKLPVLPRYLSTEYAPAGHICLKRNQIKSVTYWGALGWKFKQKTCTSCHHAMNVHCGNDNWLSR